ncbi:hypothetical protein [Cytobacillus horneckiae]|uniref:Uncharacterized protein n=1 Tax=Cytobacillus horneckiae TaxID=549687 RepID=A0A2N0ZMG3_9BACI|nr:hypothetical protein [Cytobacillus horneckiae]MEC1155034.1 hypothetical protein [Cytobacillus horneckiae]MED2936060.1 hypothetical protein [Cytobacillus horneckiae]PKG30666.1 hypothetical protein CWS20_01905 [Cytobacillus horneckiae]
MDQELKLALGKLFGEVYRIQKQQGICQISDSRIFGLLNGVEEELEGELGNLGFINREQVSIVCDQLDPFYKQEKSLKEMPSFLEFRMELEKHGISHSRLIDILKYLKSSGSYTTEIDKLGNFKLSDYDI